VSATRWPCLSRHADATWLAVSVQPGARRTGADGLHDAALRIRLSAAPVDGQANQQLIGWIAGELGVPKRAVQVIRGASSRRKCLAIETSIERVEAWLEAALEAPVSPGTSPTPLPPVR
jgi:uncharacterized protein (TIGR00251 family)